MYALIMFNVACISPEYLCIENARQPPAVMGLFDTKGITMPCTQAHCKGPCAHSSLGAHILMLCRDTRFGLVTKIWSLVTTLKVPDLPCEMHGRGLCIWDVLNSPVFAYLGGLHGI